MNDGARWRGRLFVLVAAFVIASGAARAQPSATPGAPPSGDSRLVVTLVVAAEDADAAALEASLRELLGRLGIDLVVSRAERLDLDDTGSLGRTGSFATAWIDLRSPRARAVLVDREGAIVARREVSRGGSTAIVVEELAHIVQSSVEELAESERARKPAPPPPPPPAPAPPLQAKTEAKERRAFGVDAGAFFAGRGFGTGAETVIGGGGMIGASLGRGSFRPALWLLGSYHVAFDVRGEVIDIHTKAAALRLAPTVRLLGGRGWFVEAGPEAGVDVFWTTPRANSSGLPQGRLGPDSTDSSPVLGALAVVHFALGESADLFAAAAADVDVAPHRYVVMEGPQAEPVFEQWRVRPALLVGFTFTVAGLPSYPPAEARQ